MNKANIKMKDQKETNCNNPVEAVVSDISFTPFWFESNQWFMMVNNEADFKRLIEVQSEVGYKIEDVLQAKECIRLGDDCRKFGFSRECNSSYTLGEYLSR